MAHGTPPFNALYAFIITAKHLNLTYAANELFVTQGAVSRQIASLESFLGFKVFFRHARGLTLTAKGAEILPDINVAFQQLLETTKHAMKATGEIKLKATTCSTRWLIPHLVKLQNDYPDLHVALSVSTDHDVDFSKEDFDAAIIYTEDPINFTENALLANELTIKLFDEVLCPVVAPSLIESTKIFDINRHTFLHPTEDKKDWQLWINKTKQNEIIMKNNQHFETMGLAISAAIQGLGVTIADLNLLTEDIRMNRLRQIISSTVPTGASYYLKLKSSHTATSAIETFIEVLTGNQ
ncbi:LysR substrate-binding domain-containing protein [Psychromonas sp.]|uniref:LysR substrate-binding domain-containing protein n=1 Tax=Psychromonas sp. TaxID=1884585 RepID=UPI003A9819FC